MSEFDSHISVEEGSDKGFGIVFAIIFLLIGLYPLLEGNEVRLWSLMMATVLSALAYVAPKMLSVPNKLWFWIATAMGAVLAPLVMAFIYIISVVPIGLIMRLAGKDLLRKKLDRNATTYWVVRTEPLRSMRDQF